MEETEAELEKYVRQFLYEFKSLIHEKGLRVMDREKNRDSLLELGLTGKQREETVLEISVLDYSSGPNNDIYKPGQFWVFGKYIEGVEIYIKLKLAGPPGNEHPTCFSFHRSEYPLNYPFKR